MATQASLNFVQNLYVAYYGRPADSEGLQYWADRAEAEGEGAIINAFGNSPEFQDSFGDLSNEQLVNNLYQQLFSREADDAGLTYYAGVLAAGEKTLAEIALTISNAAQGSDRTVLNTKVQAADYYTSNVPAGSFNADNAKELLLAIDSTSTGGDYDDFVAAVDAQIPVSDSSIQAFVTAQENLNTFLEETAENEELLTAIDGADETTADDAITVDEIQEARDTALGGETLNVLETRLEDANADLAAAEDDLTVTQNQRVNTLNSSIEALKNQPQESVLNARTDTAEAEFAAGVATGFDYTLDGAVPDASSASDISAALVSEAGSASTPARDALADVDGGDLLTNAADAQIARDNAEKAVSDAEDALGVTLDAEYNVDDTSGAQTEVAAYYSAQDTQEQAQDTYDTAKELSDLATQAETLEQSVTDAQSDLNATVQVADVTAFADTDSVRDLFIFNEDNVASNVNDITLDYSTDGVTDGDTLFFSGFNLGSDVEAGNNNALEIFFSEEAGNAVITVENSTFGSADATNGTFDVTLTGITQDQLSFDNGVVSIA